MYNVSGAFPVSGWAADTDGIQKIEVLIDNGDHAGRDPRRSAPGRRPDVPRLQRRDVQRLGRRTSTRRASRTASTLLTVRATDKQGVENTIGHRTIQIINNDNFLKPFGYLDEPQRDAVLFGTGCVGDQEPPPVSPPIRPEEHLTAVRGWALDLGTRGGTGRVAYAELLVDGVRWLRYR